MDKIITRFAPSPTGYIHFGNIRTAFFCWLFARKNCGKFLLRIDDTDDKRYKEKYVNNILDILNWLGISYDGELIFQSDRYSIYESYLNYLVNIGKAYKCYCSKERLEVLKNNQVLNKSKIMYDGFCKNKSVFFKSDDFVIRFLVNLDGFTEFNDLIRGIIKIPNKELDDFIISKKYKPTYNFATAIDDIEFGITDVIRGEDHISNTQKQILIIKSFDRNFPRFAHLPMILDADRKKISKRDSSIYMNYYINRGFLPMAILNYVIKLGWGYKNVEVFSLDDMIKYFDIKNVSKASSCLDLNKLLSLNKYYIQNTNLSRLFYLSIPVLKHFHFDYFYGPSIIKLLEFNKNKFSTLYDLFDSNSYYYSLSICENLFDYLSTSALYLIKNFYFDLKKSFYFWTICNIKNHIDFFVRENNMLFSDLAFPLRFIITGKQSSNSLYDLIFLCGRILLLKKIINTLKKVGL